MSILSVGLISSLDSAILIEAILLIVARRIGGVCSADIPVALRI